MDDARHPSQDHGLHSLFAAKKAAGLGCCRQPRQYVEAGKLVRGMVTTGPVGNSRYNGKGVQGIRD